MINNQLNNNARAIMTYNIIYKLMELNLFKNKESIINIGSFDLIEYVDIDLAMKLLNSLNLKANEDEIYSHIEKKRISSKILWKKLGLKESVFIDADGVHDSLSYDLNLDIKQEYNFDKKFDVVTNFGTTEHVFNQYQVFKNIHNLCKKDGIIIHSLPIQGAWEHGMYNYHPNFFFALADKNNYKIEYFGIRHKDLQNYNIVELKEPEIKPFLKEINAYDTMGSVVILRKQDNEEFKIPLQSRYDKY